MAPSSPLLTSHTDLHCVCFLVWTFGKFAESKLKK